MKNFLRGIAILILTWLAGEAIKKVLVSGAGRAVLNRVGHPEIATLEGAQEASKKLKQGIDLAQTLTNPPKKAPAPRVTALTGPNWLRTMRDAAELLLATGAMLKAVADFIREDEGLRRRFERLGARIETE